MSDDDDVDVVDVGDGDIVVDVDDAVVGVDVVDNNNYVTLHIRRILRIVTQL